MYAVQPFLGEKKRDFVDIVDVLGGDDGFEGDVREQRDFALDIRRQGPVRPAEQDIGLDADRPELFDAVLGGLGLELPGGADIGHESEMDKEHVLRSELEPHLAGRLEKRQAFDVAHRPADLVDDDIVPLGYGLERRS